MQRNSKIISAALGVFLMLIMSSCGFKPMYGANSAGGSGLSQVMANIEIDRIRNMQGRQERLSQFLQKNLIERKQKKNEKIFTKNDEISLLSFSFITLSLL